MMRRNKEGVLGLALSLTLLSLVLPFVFFWLPRYTAPTFLGITRPTLFPASVLWAMIAFECLRLCKSHPDRILQALLPTVVILFLANSVQLYSRVPHDAAAILTHILRLGGYLVLFLMLIRIAALNVAERILAEGKLARLNEELERRVFSRTAELTEVNKTLQVEITARQRTEVRLRDQLGQLDLINHITRAIGERQDLQSIFQVVITALEGDLPIDFGCICLSDEHRTSLNVASTGIKSQALASELGITPGTLIPVSPNALAPCMQGKVVYEPDLKALAFPFPQKLVDGGLHAMVATPLILEGDVFGTIIAARHEANSFRSDECEFLRQLGEHVALAARQTQLHGALQRAYDDLRQTREAAMQQERLRAFGEMASGVAHDINNAISPVTMYAELLLEGEPNLSERTIKGLKTIQRAAGDVADTIARLRDFYRQREPQTGMEPVNINELVEQVVDLTRSRWNDMPQQSGIMIEVTKDLVPDAPVVLGVESEIRDALINLVFNAVDAMPNGGKLTLKTRVTEHTTPAGKKVQDLHLAVSDTGVGMDEEARLRCTEPFYTTKGERGTGLGLAMVYGSMRRHNAEVEIESEPGNGTTVNVCFPVPIVVNTSSSQSADIQIVTVRMRILVIDDDPLLLKTLGETLALDGHDVVTAVGGKAGIEAFQAAKEQNRSFVVVFTDLGMPHIDGRRVASAIKAIEPASTVILLTGWGQQLNVEGTLPLHIDRVLSKPPKLRELREALALAFENAFK
jgi:signal transduction histidine kinase/ActR/RegA family two-component response regulator